MTAIRLISTIEELGSSFANGKFPQWNATTHQFDAADAGGLTGVFPVTDYGAIGDGATDDTATIQAAIQAAYAAGGGIVFFPPATYRVNGRLVIPNDGTAIPTQPCIKLVGVGASHAGREMAPNGGSILDLRYGGPAISKIVTHGVGLFEMTGLTLKDDGTDTTAFLLATLTTPHIHGCEFYGNPTKSGSTCDQDAIILGGTTTTMDGTDDCPFQGYGAVIRENYFNHIRRGVYGRTWCNGSVVRDNIWWSGCGGNAAAIEILGVVASANSGNLIEGNLLEISGYAYPIKFTYASDNVIAFNGFYDNSGTNVAYVRFDTNANFNLCIPGFHSDAIPFIEEDASVTGQNTVITFHQNQLTKWTQPFQFSSTATVYIKGTTTSPVGLIVEDSNGNQWYPQNNSEEQVYKYKPFGASAEDVIAIKRFSATDKRLFLRGSVQSIIEGSADLHVQSASGSVLYLGDASTDCFVIGGETWYRQGKGLIFKDQTTGAYYRLNVNNGAVQLTAL